MTPEEAAAAAAAQNTQTQPPERKFTQAELDKIIGDRLATHKQSQQDLQSENQKLSEQLDAQQQGQQAQQGQTQETQGGASIEDIQNLMDTQHSNQELQRQQAEERQANEQGSAKLEKLKKSDPEFSRLLSDDPKSKGYDVPEGVKHHVLNSLGEEDGKNVLMDLMKNNNSNMGMQLALSQDQISMMQGQQPTKYMEWLKGASSAPKSSKNEMDDVPNIDESGTAPQSETDRDNYIRNM